MPREVASKVAHPAHIELADTHRLIPSKYAGTSVLETLSLAASVLAQLSELDAATNERNLAEQGRALSIGPGELLLGVPEAQIINAAFCHPGPDGCRFNDNRRGAWYAGWELETALAEVAFHKRRFLQDARFTDPSNFEYQDFLADFSGEYSELDDIDRESCLQPEPVPQRYRPGQALANTLLYSGSNGIVYPSVRTAGGTCIACFRPALVFHPRRAGRYILPVQAGVPWNPAQVQEMGTPGTE
jgi:hypothetical protein